MSIANRSADEWHDQAAALFRAGSLGAAEQHVRKCLECNPRHGNGHALLGEIIAARGDHDQAVSLHQRAVQIDPKAARYRCYLATSLASLGKFRDAITQYERALKLRPNFPRAIGGLAHVLTMRGRYDDAAALLAPFLKKKEITARMAAVHARLRYSVKAYDEVVTFVRDVDSEALELAPRRDLLATLGLALEKLERYDEAFEAFARSNSLPDAKFDVDAMTARFATIRASFSREALAATPEAKNDSALPIFIVGLPRSGSTLIEQIIHAHPQAFGAGEIPDLNRALATMHAAGDDEVTEDQMSSVADRYLRSLRNRGRNAKRIVDKNLGNAQHLGIMSRLYPNATIIRTTRGFMDTGLSCFKHPLIATLHPWSTRLEWIGAFFREYDALMHHWNDVLDVNVLDVNYEDLVSEPKTHARRIIEHCGLPWDDACLRFHEARRDVTTISYDQITQPMYTSAVESWRHYEAHLGPLRDALGRLADASATMEARA